jgi:hypothetical protein
MMSSHGVAVAPSSGAFRRSPKRSSTPLRPAAAASRRPCVTPSAALFGAHVISGNVHRSLVSLRKRTGAAAGVSHGGRSSGGRRGTRGGGGVLTVNALPNVLGFIAEVVGSGLVVGSGSAEMAAAAAGAGASTAAAATTATTTATAATAATTTATVAAAATGAVATAAATGGGGFWGYLITFLLGGAFFSTAFGVAALFISVGGENVRRAFRVFQFLSSRVLTLVGAVLVCCFTTFLFCSPDVA